MEKSNKRISLDSGYGSAGTSSAKKIEESLSAIEKSQSSIYKVFENEIVLKLEKDPKNWNKILTKLKEIIKDYNDWAELDLTCIKKENVKTSINGFSILMLTQTKAVLESDFLVSLIEIYEEKTSLKSKNVFSNCFQRKGLNFMHCLAEQFALEGELKGFLNENQWKIYTEMCSRYPDLLKAEDVFERTPDQIIYSSGVL